MNEKLITGIGAVRLFVSDLDRAVDFYSNPLGMDLTARDGSLYAVFQLPHVTLLLEQMSSDDAEFKELVGRFTGVSLTTRDIRAAYERLSGSGVRFAGSPEKQFWGGTLAHFHDPDNNVLTLLEAPAAG